jgi:hypothetical protein
MIHVVPRRGEAVGSKTSCSGAESFIMIGFDVGVFVLEEIDSSFGILTPLVEYSPPTLAKPS